MDSLILSVYPPSVRYTQTDLRETSTLIGIADHHTYADNPGWLDSCRRMTAPMNDVLIVAIFTVIDDMMQTIRHQTHLLEGEWGV